MSRKPPKAPEVIAEELSLPMCGVDSHAHLDSKQFDADRDAVIERAKACGISHLINIFMSPQEFPTRSAYFAKHPEVFFALGIHPCDAMLCNEENMELMEQYFKTENRLKALGEIGLDFYWDDCPKDVQMEVFVKLLTLARKLDKPVVIHSRDATDATIAVLEKEGFKDYPLLWHCFGGDVQDVKRILYNGWYISVPGPVTYPKNEALREAVRKIPLDKIMLETDAPYLTPQEWRGKRNEPAYTVCTVAAMAKALNMLPHELWQVCGDNARRFFNIANF